MPGNQPFEDFSLGAHTHRFHHDPQRELTGYNVFHDDHSQKNSSTYRTLRATAWNPSMTGGGPPVSTQRQDLTIGGLGANTYKGPNGEYLTASLATTLKTDISSRFSTGRPYPTQYKAYLTEHRDEYRDPVVQQHTLKELTTKYNTIKPAPKKNPQPLYETRVVAF